MHGISEQLISHYLWKPFLCTPYLRWCLSSYDLVVRWYFWWYQSSHDVRWLIFRRLIFRRLLYKLLRLVDSHLRLIVLLCH